MNSISHPFASASPSRNCIEFRSALETAPLAIDLFTGLHGWAEGLIAAGYRVVGFDIEDMSRKLGEPMPEGDFQLVVQDVLTMHGSQFRDARLIVGSSPCQEFSYRAMPFKKARALGPPELGMALFHAQFRIQREASEAAGHHVPLVVENVRGAERWVGRAKLTFGPFALWGDVPALLPDASASRKLGGSWFHGYAPGVQGPRNHASGSLARKAASAKIAKIPLTLSTWIGRCHFPAPLSGRVFERASPAVDDATRALASGGIAP